ncbi:protein regulator of cytokinesis 1-like [Phlebotomus papatasi]|uniref:protein regulator of cytokinesis 1-like n=1 Tax=Phlebotomus papatasi TaxID=29031 RepID=UPI002483E6E8|nr:protein regulator of cytokinesis 1-like [Phlebotomus papatasi]
MDNLSKLQAQVEAEISQITHESLNTLRELWHETYEASMGEDNFMIMSNHVRSFYDEIIQETVKRKSVIVEDIQKLHDEASNLRRLLQIDFQLSPKKNIPLHSLRAYLDESLKNLRQQLKRRKDEIYELLVEQEDLCDDLGEECRELVDDPLPTAEDLEDFKRYLDKLKGVREERTTEVIQLRRDIKLSLMTLEISLITEADKALVNSMTLPIKTEHLQKLRDMKEEFSSRCRNLATSIDSTRKKLVILWDYLEVGEDVRQRYAGYSEICQTTLDKLQEELMRREKEKKQNIKKVVDKIREEIAFWWNKTLKSDLEMSRFSNFTSELYTEDLLTLHEMELEQLKFFYHSNEKIFELIEERKTLWDQMKSLEKSANNPNRFNNRGGQLLKEERERKTISSKLPKIEKELRELVQAYEKTNLKKFTMFGESVEEVIYNDHEKRKLEKEKLMSARKMIKSTTPTHSRLLTPMPSRTNITGFTSIINNKAKTVGAKPAAVPSMKRKMGRHPDESIAKRSILKELASPNLFVRPKSVKKPVKPIKVIATMQNRNGNRRSSGKQKRLSGKLVARGIAPRIKINSQTDSDSISYECFESYLGDRSPCRSSLMKSPVKKKSPTPSPSKKTKDLPIIM